MSAALLSLAGLFISAYLYLYKIGKIGTLACGTGGCETVQLSPWSRFGGVEVALIGLVGYATLLLLSLLSLQPPLALKRWPSSALAILAGVGLVFTGYLTYVELFVLHAICRWCVASAVIIVSIFAVSVLGYARDQGDPEAQSRLSQLSRSP
ncbi:MAG TPA: vitamin K epoxide reductase family protein [Gemmatimonadales bacterium]|nr:vitamin K epoxide reductase family protein [Gemmatimonadales bacterium]